jgi:hypothetical protein
VHEVDAPKAGWLSSFPAGPSEKEALGRIVDGDGGRDDAENSYYEIAADPAFIRLETMRRRFRGQYLRALKRRRDQARPSRV